MLPDLQSIVDLYNNYIKTTRDNVKKLQYYARGEITMFIYDSVGIIKKYIHDEHMDIMMYVTGGVYDTIGFDVRQIYESKYALSTDNIHCIKCTKPVGKCVIFCRECWLKYDSIEYMNEFGEKYKRIIEKDNEEYIKFKNEQVFIPKEIVCRVYEKLPFSFVDGQQIDIRDKLKHRLVTFRLLNQAAYTTPPK